MRCPECQEENPEGLAVCQSCDTPFTAYGGQVAGAANPETLAKLARLRIRPQAVPAMCGLCLLIALLGPVRTALAAFLARPATNAEGTNYLSSAFGAVGVFLQALVFLPLAGAIFLAVWGAWAQRTWAWTACLVIAGGTALASLFGMGGMPILLRMVVAAACLSVLALWIRPNTREWFGAD